jgi:hypothetical protein
MNISNKINHKQKAFIGIYDFSYAPYALGDAITWQMNLCVRAIDNGMENIVQYIVTDPSRPSCSLQPYITKNNYIDYINNLFPVFLCCPNTSLIHLIKNKNAFDLFLLTKIFHSQSTWPSIMGHLMGKLDFSSHKTIDKFFQKYNYIPRLMAPRGYENSMNSFLEKRCENRFVVSVNIRQRRLYPNFHEEVSDISRRDSPLVEWDNLFKIIKGKYPNVVFLVLGGYSTWERELYNYENVIIPRTMGFGLAHELTLLHKSDLFMGTSSGFSAMATFSRIPYIITNFDHAASRYVDLPVGTPRYPFGLDNQILSWEKESTELLLSLFEPIYESLRES